MGNILSISDIKDKKGKEKIVCLTAYTFPIAQIVDSHCDLILVGDSVGMVVYGMDSTLRVTLDMMIEHGRAVVKARKKALVVVDMPFSSYFTRDVAYINAARILQETGCDAVKLEGGVNIADTIEFLVTSGIPVMGHVGLMPQYFKKLGGYKCQGRTDSSRIAIKEDVKAVCQSGAFSVVLECIPESLATEITESTEVPTIGIGASNICDGQILVVDDMLGFGSHCPRFVKRFASLECAVSSAIKAYAEEVRGATFPGKAQCYE